MINPDKALELEVKYRKVPDLRVTVEGMKFNKWHKIDRSLYHNFVMFTKVATRHTYRVLVKLKNKEAFVKKVKK